MDLNLRTLPLWREGPGAQACPWHRAVFGPGLLAGQLLRTLSGIRGRVWELGVGTMGAPRASQREQTPTPVHGRLGGKREWVTGLPRILIHPS